jgi:Protein of unknown function (DUF3352)
LLSATPPPHRRHHLYARRPRGFDTRLALGARRPRGFDTRLALGVLIAAATLTGCGSSGSSGNGDPATLTPAAATLSASIAVNPSGTASSTARVLTHLAEPYGSIAQTLLSTEASHVEFKREVKPWIGKHAGVFITSLDTSGLPRGATSAQGLLEVALTGGLSSLSAGTFGRSGAQGAIVLSTSNVSGARSFLAQRAQEQQAHAVSYRGVSYRLSTNGTAEGIVGEFAVIGSESGMKSVIDTSLGGANITSAPGYAKAPTDAIANLYVKPEELASSIHGSGGSPAQGISLLSKLLAGAQTASLSVTSTANSLSLQGETHSASGSTPLFDQEGAHALGEVPGGAWLAAGVGDTGSNLTHALGLLHAVASVGSSTVFASIGGASIEKLFGKIEAPNAKLQQDFGSWAGPGAMFVSGTGLFNLEAALVIASKDPTASSAAVGKLAKLMGSSGASISAAQITGADKAMSVRLTGFPAVLFIASGGGKFVIGLGQASVTGALNPTSTLSSSSSYSTAATTLGGGIQPSLIVEFPTLLGFLESVGLTQSTTLSSFIPYLKSLGTLTAGAVNQSGSQRFRLVLGLSSS